MNDRSSKIVVNILIKTAFTKEFCAASKRYYATFLNDKIKLCKLADIFVAQLNF